MPLDLPSPVAAYFAADRHDGEAVARCFSADGVVTDEGRRHAGRAAITRWKAEAASKYSYTSTPIACVREGARTVVTARVAGNFPGSPVDLRYVFTLAGDEIAALRIGTA